MSELREAAQAVLNDYDGDGTVEDTERAIDRLRAALAQPETAEPVAWMWQHDETGRIGFVDAWQLENGWRELNPRLNVVRPLYAHPPRDEWRLASEVPEDGRDVVVWMNDGGHGCFAIGHCLRGAWTPNYVGSPVTHWRDVQPPTECSK